MGFRGLQPSGSRALGASVCAAAASFCSGGGGPEVTREAPILFLSDPAPGRGSIGIPTINFSYLPPPPWFRKRTGSVGLQTLLLVLSPCPESCLTVVFPPVTQRVAFLMGPRESEPPGFYWGVPSLRFAAPSAGSAAFVARGFDHEADRRAPRGAADWSHSQASGRVRSRKTRGCEGATNQTTMRAGRALVS